MAGGDEFEQYFEKEDDSFEQYFEPTAAAPSPAEEGLMGHLRGALRGAAAEREPGLVRSFLELAAQPPGQGPLAAAVHAAGDVVPGAQQLAAAAQAGLTDQTYAQARQEQEARAAAGAEANPGAARAGTGAAIIAQLGGPVGVWNILRSSPQMIRGLISSGVLTREALAGALKGAGAGAAVGAALSDADIPLAEGRPGEAAGQALGAAANPTALALGGLIGGAAGAGKARLRADAAAQADKARQVQALDEYTTAKDAYPEQVAAAKAQAEAAVRVPTPDNAVRWFGFDRLTKRKAGASRARAVRLMNEPVPGGQGETWMQARERFGDDIAGWQKYADDVKGQLGEGLGDIRDALTKVDDARVDAKALKERLEKAGGEFPEESVERLVNKAKAWVDKGAKEGVLSPERLRQLIKNLEGAGEDAYALRRAAVDVEKRLVAQHLPQRNEEYRVLLGKWADANELTQGAEKQYLAVNKGSAPVRFDKPAKVDVPEPQFPGGVEAQGRAEELLKAEITTRQQVGRSALRAIGGAAGAALSQATGIPFAGYAGAATGYQTGQALGQRWIQAARPTINGIIGDSEVAQRVLARWAPHLEAAMRRGPRAVRSLHRALSESDPEYAWTMENAGRSAPSPLSFGEFSNGWRRGR